MAITGRCYCGAYGGPQAVIWTTDAQPWRLMPHGAPQFPGFPGR